MVVCTSEPVERQTKTENRKQHKTIKEHNQFETFLLCGTLPGPKKQILLGAPEGLGRRDGFLGSVSGAYRIAKEIFEGKSEKLLVVMAQAFKP